MLCFLFGGCGGGETGERQGEGRCVGREGGVREGRKMAESWGGAGGAREELLHQPEDGAILAWIRGCRGGGTVAGRGRALACGTHTVG